MTDYRRIEQRLSEALGLKRRPVAVTFRDTAPAGMEKFTGTEPSGCSFWRVAARGRIFYTVPSDHYNCAIGSHTHNIPLAPEHLQELEQTLSFMTGIGSIRMEEVPGIPRLPQTPDESAGQFGCDSPSTRTARKTVRSWSVPLATNRTRRLQRSTITAHPNHASSRALRLSRCLCRQRPLFSGPPTRYRDR